MTSCKAQLFGYQKYSEVNGVEFDYKFGKARDEAGEKRPALMMKIKNENEYPVSFGFSLDFYYEGVLRETSGDLSYCLEANSTAMGKLNGVYFILEEFTPEQVERKDFDMQINSIDVGKIDNCPEEDRP